MKLFGLRFGRPRAYVPVRFVGREEEPRTRSATKRFRFGDVVGNIYSPYNDEQGETEWRFSLVKVVKSGDGPDEYRRSFDLEDATDLYKVIDRCAEFISRAMKL